MAKLLEKDASTEEALVGELDALLPERELTIGGKTVVVYPFTLRDTLQVMAMAQPLIDDLGQLFLQSSTVYVYDVQLILSKHAEITEQLIARSVRESVDWVANLSTGDGLVLFDTFWTVNVDFFTDGARRRAFHLEARAKSNATSGMPNSLPNSSPQDTANANSATTPNGS